MDIPDFKDWGWHKDNSGRWLPFWSTLEDSSKAYFILLQCCCVRSCRGNCKCSKAGVQQCCTGLCRMWRGMCHQYLLIYTYWFIYWFIDWLAIVIIVLISCCFSVVNMLSKGTLVHTISVIFTNVHVYLQSLLQFKGLPLKFVLSTLVNCFKHRRTWPDSVCSIVLSWSRLRSADGNQLVVPRTLTSTFGPRASLHLVRLLGILCRLSLSLIHISEPTRPY